MFAIGPSIASLLIIITWMAYDFRQTATGASVPSTDTTAEIGGSNKAIREAAQLKSHLKTATEAWSAETDDYMRLLRTLFGSFIHTFTHPKA